MPSPTCPKCSGKMHEGFILDVGYGTVLQPRWMAGPPEKSWWTGIKVKGRVKYRVTTYRCEKCGYLESYGIGEAK